MGCMPACIWDDNGRADEATAETALTFKAERATTLVLCSSESEEGTRARADREPRKREAWMDEWILDRSRDEGGGRQNTKDARVLYSGRKAAREREVWSGWEGPG